MILSSAGNGHPKIQAPKTVYDAAYLELAIRLDFALATKDEGLGKAAVRANVAVIAA